jgi:hypothetical protein
MNTLSGACNGLSASQPSAQLTFTLTHSPYGVHSSGLALAVAFVNNLAQ